MFKFLVFFIYLNPTHFLYILNDIHWFESVFQYQLYLIQMDEQWLGGSTTGIEKNDSGLVYIAK